MQQRAIGVGYSSQAMSLHHVVFVMMLMLSVSGCASMRPASAPELKPFDSVADGKGMGWWYARFRMNWTEDAKPLWHLDAFLADRVVSPALVRYGDRISLWRFHRRAARDQAGHQFSFIFYSSPDTAGRVFRTIRSDLALKGMKDAGMVLLDSYDDTSSIQRPEIEDTCDPSWSTAVKKSWPYYIMGVSRMWLNMISEISRQTSGNADPSSARELEEHYRRVNDSVEELWRKEGGHALLHHLNAIFGYEPLQVGKEHLMRF